MGRERPAGAHAGIPDMRFINRRVPIADVARALDLRFDGPSKLHCWHPEKHQNGDRTASVGIHQDNNTVKCFACDSRPMGPIDFVMEVRGISAADAALWIAERFEVPYIPKRKRLSTDNLGRERVGYEQGLGLLIRSGIWAGLSAPAKAIAAVLLEFGEKSGTFGETLQIKMAYRTISRYTGVQSHNAIRKALKELSEVGFVVLPPSTAPRHPDRRTSTYLITPNSQALFELAQSTSHQMRQEIEPEIELRKRDRNARLCSKRKRTQNDPESLKAQATNISCTKYKHLYSGNSVKREDASPGIA